MITMNVVAFSVRVCRFLPTVDTKEWQVRDYAVLYFILDRTKEMRQ